MDKRSLAAGVILGALGVIAVQALVKLVIPLVIVAAVAGFFLLRGGRNEPSTRR